LQFHLPTPQHTVYIDAVGGTHGPALSHPRVRCHGPAAGLVRTAAGHDFNGRGDVPLLPGGVLLQVLDDVHPLRYVTKDHVEVYGGSHKEGPRWWWSTKGPDEQAPGGRRKEAAHGPGEASRHPERSERCVWRRCGHTRPRPAARCAAFSRGKTPTRAKPLAAPSPMRTYRQASRRAPAGCKTGWCCCWAHCWRTQRRPPRRV